MGTWGAGLFDDDLASDVRGSFEDCVGSGMPVAEAAEAVLAEYGDVDDADERAILDLAVAVLLLERSSLTEPIAARALAVTRQGLGLDRWLEAGLEAERKGVYTEIEERIAAALNATPQSPPP